jgi:N,N'-diacetylchitobiose transport system permease protein
MVGNADGPPAEPPTLKRRRKRRLRPSVASAAETASLRSRRRRPLTWGRVLHVSAPYWLIAPVVVVVGGILGYPIYRLVRLSLEQYQLEELIRQQGRWIGLDNFSSVLRDSVFWDTLQRTVVFTVATVGLTMVIGILLALLLVRISSWVRVLLTAGLVLVWSMPVVVAVQVWIWMTNHQNGVLNHVLTQLGVGDFFQHDWYASPFSQLGMTSVLIVWGAIPFVVVSVYAGLAQVPAELIEAAAIDGARPWRVFLDVTIPVLKPILLILTSLSIIWDFGVFPQPFLLIGVSHLDASNYLMGIYLYNEGYKLADFGRGATISLLMLLMVAAMSVFYVRQMLKIGENR